MSDGEASESPENEGSGTEEKVESTSTKEEEEEDDREVSYGMYQSFVFVSCFVGHCMFLYNRRVFQFVLPHIMNEHALSGLDVTLIIMAQQISHTISAFFVGVWIDKTNVKTVFAAGMFFVGFFNFGFSDIEEPSNLMMFAIFSGLGQGLGWPCCAKIVRHWFPQESFGFWWAMMNQSSFLVGLVGPIVANNWSSNHGWRVAVQMPAVISMVVSVGLYFTIFEKPSDVGYDDQTFPGAETKLHWQEMLSSWFMMLLCGAGFLLNMIRQSTLDWGQLFLMEEKSLSVYNAGSFSIAMGFGGAIGTVIIAAMADFAIKRNLRIGYYRYPRMILLFVSLFGGGLLMSSMILSIDAYSTSAQVNTFAFLMGFAFSAAIQNLEALVIETAPPNKFNACFALLSISLNMATVIAGFPISFLAASYGWSKTFLFLNFSVMVSFLGVILGKDLEQNFIPEPPKSKKVR